MLFNSTAFLLFFAAFVLLYSLVRSHLRARNLLILAASYLFYGWWDGRFLCLLILSSLVDFQVGLAIAQAPSDRLRRRWIGVSVLFNLGILGTFKYFGFFLQSFHALLDSLGVQHPSPTWQIVLPVGISFYTFQSLGYTLDVYRRRIEPARDRVAFLAFVSFFPQLVAGPIERASHLLPQFQSPRTLRLHDVESGAWLALWGLFKKVVVADQLAPYAELAFDHDLRSAPVLLLGTVAFAGQIYGDFSGYSDIARGIARCLGFDLMRNFDRPYAATSLRDFWRRWHISLSTWMRDYLYIPLGGNQGTEARIARNLLLTFVIAGLWHGAAWNFVLWGAWHGLALVVQRRWSLLRAGPLPTPLARALTLLTVGYGWMLFRATQPGALVELHTSLLVWTTPPWTADLALGILPWLLPLVALEFWPGAIPSATTLIRLPHVVRATLAGAAVLAIAAYWERDAVPFLYFQF